MSEFDCKFCKRELPLDHVQQNGMHMDCHDEEITVWRTSINGEAIVWLTLTDATDHLNLMEDDIDDDGILIEKSKMSRGRFYALSEFDGY